MEAIEEFLESFPYAEREIFEALPEEIETKEPDLSFLARLIRNIIDERKYSQDPVALLRGVTRIIVPQDEKKKALTVFVAVHPIIGLMLAPVILSDYTDEWNEYLSLAKHIYLDLKDVYCWGVEAVLSLSDEFSKQKKETLRLFASAMAKIAKDVATLAASEDLYSDASALFSCAEKAAVSSEDSESLLEIIESRALMLYMQGDYKESLKEYKRLLEIGKLNAWRELKVKLKVAELLIATGNPEEALPMLDEIEGKVNRLRRMGFASKYELALVMLYKGRALKKLGELKRAEKILKKAYDLVKKQGGELKRMVMEELIEIFEALGKQKEIEKLRR